MNNFVCILDTTDRFLFEISKQLLNINEIEFQERNSVDTMYQNFGAYQIFVNKEDEEKAKQLLNNEGE
jgi:hypothetical protein